MASSTSSAPHAVLHKAVELRVVVGVTSILSVLGSLLIIFSYVCFKDIRTRARLILVHLSLADMGVALANFVGDVVYFDRFYEHNGTIVEPPLVKKIFCEAQAFFALYFTISSILWTCVLSVYMYFLVMEKGGPLMRAFVWFSYVISYGIPIIVCVWTICTGRLGFSPYNSSGWCTLILKKVNAASVHEDPDIYAAIFSYDLWIVTTMVLIAVVYVCISFFIRNKEVSM